MNSDDAIDSDDVVNFCLPKSWPTNRKLRAHISGQRLQIEAPLGRHTETGPDRVSLPRGGPLNVRVACPILSDAAQFAIHSCRIHLIDGIIERGREAKC